MLLTPQLPLLAVTQEHSSVEQEGSSALAGPDSAPLNECSQYNDPGISRIYIQIKKNKIQPFERTENQAPTFSFSIARAAMFAFLKLTKAQNLSCSTRMLSISPYLQCKNKQLKCVKSIIYISVDVWSVLISLYILKRSRRCFSVSSVVTFPTHSDGHGLLTDQKQWWRF